MSCAPYTPGLHSQAACDQPKPGDRRSRLACWFLRLAVAWGCLVVHGRAATAESINSFAEQAADALYTRLPAAGPLEEVLPVPDVNPPAVSSDAGVRGDFPSLPPPPGEDLDSLLPPLSEELWHHGGSYLYQPEGDRLQWPAEESEADFDLLRLPEDWRRPRPFTLGSDFLGADPVFPFQPPTWLWPSQYSWDNRFAAYGAYELFGFGIQQGQRRQNVVGHQVRLDLDLRVTGTERAHVQFRPLGRRNTGGSYYQFSDPAGYEDNSTGAPDRYWIEGELHSLLGTVADPLSQRYLNFVVGRFPFAMHNELLMNDEVLGAVVSQNNLQFGGLTSVNLQFMAGVDSVDTFPGVSKDVYGVHASIDRQRVFYELTYAFVRSSGDRDTHYMGVSRTKSYGPLGVALRALFKQGDEGGTGSGQLVTCETNLAVTFPEHVWGFQHGVGFCNVFWASEGWNSIGGGNFNRLRTAFVVNPLVRLAAGPAPDDVLGVAVGMQLFRHHDDESLIPEIAWEQPGGRSVFGVGLRYLRKTGPRTYAELLAVFNESDDPRFEREGLFASHHWVF